MRSPPTLYLVSVNVNELQLAVDCVLSSLYSHHQNELRGGRFTLGVALFYYTAQFTAQRAGWCFVLLAA